MLPPFSILLHRLFLLPFCIGQFIHYLYRYLSYASSLSVFNSIPQSLAIFTVLFSFLCRPFPLSSLLRSSLFVLSHNASQLGDHTPISSSSSPSSSSIRLRPFGLFLPPGNHLPISFVVFLYFFSVQVCN